MSLSWVNSELMATFNRVCRKKRKRAFKKVSRAASRKLHQPRWARKSAKAYKSRWFNQSVRVSNRRAPKCRQRHLSCQVALSPSHHSNRNPSIFKRHFCTQTLCNLYQNVKNYQNTKFLFFYVKMNSCLRMHLNMIKKHFLQSQDDEENSTGHDIPIVANITVKWIGKLSIISWKWIQHESRQHSSLSYRQLGYRIE